MSEPRRIAPDMDATLPGQPVEGPPLIRYSVRHLLFTVTLLSLLMASMAVWGGLTALAVLLATAVVAVHLLSTAIGTQLRSHANRRHPPNRSFDPTEATTDSERPSPFAAPDATQLGLPRRSPWHKRCSTPLPWRRRWIVGASVTGGVLGAGFLFLSIGERISVAGIVVGSLSMAIVAGWVAFLAYSFCTVLCHGLQDAMAGDRGDGRC